MSGYPKDRRPGGSRGRQRSGGKPAARADSGPGLRRGDGNRAWLALALLLTASPAFAHPGHADLSGFVAGLLHPFTGLDHLVAMLLVGLWAGIAFPRHWWACPLAFMAFMLAGFSYGAGGGSLPIAEMLIVGSVVGLGLALLADIRPPLALGAGAVALFAIGHGYAHGSEMTAGADSIRFAAGFLIATAALHAAGLALAFAVAGRKRVGQAAGLAATIAGAAMVWPV